MYTTRTKTEVLLDGNVVDVEEMVRQLKFHTELAKNNTDLANKIADQLKQIESGVPGIVPADVLVK